MTQVSRRIVDASVNDREPVEARTVQVMGSVSEYWSTRPDSDRRPSRWQGDGRLDFIGEIRSERSYRVVSINSGGSVCREILDAAFVGLPATTRASEARLVLGGLHQRKQDALPHEAVEVSAIAFDCAIEFPLLVVAPTSHHRFERA